MKGSLYRPAILKPQSKFVFPAVDIVNYDSLFKEKWITFKKEMASWEYFYTVYIEVPQNLQFI